MTSQDLPTLLVLGGGNSPEGVSKVTEGNARFASKLLLEGQGNLDLAITSGYGQPSNNVFPVSEARAMKDIITADLVENDGKVPQFAIEERSTTTIENMKYVAPLLESFCVDYLGIVANMGHADRAIQVSRRRLPSGIEVVPLYSDIPGLFNRVNEAALRTVYHFADKVGSDPDKADQIYEQITGGPKKILGKLSVRYSG